MNPSHSLPRSLQGFIAFLLLLPPVRVFAQPPGYFTPDPLASITRDDIPAFQSAASPMILIAPANGSASAQVVIAGDRRNLHLPFLASETGPRIPGESIRIRYAMDRIPDHEWSQPTFDALMQTPDSSLPFQPVWVTVQVPPGTPAGVYRGFMGNTAGVRVPVELRVPDFTIDSPAHWTSIAYAVQSPDAIAWTYKHDLWSREHFQKLRPSMELLGGLGNNVLHLTVLRNTHFGNDFSLVVFRREGNRVVPDFRFVDTYLDLYARFAAPPRVLWLYLWESGRNINESPELEVTFVEPNGSLTAGTLPRYGDGGATDEPWQLLINGMRDRVRQRGWDPASIMVGAAQDARPTPEMVAFFNSFTPVVQWVMFSHWRGDNIRTRPMLIEGMDVGYAESPHDPRNNRLINQTTLGGGWATEPEENAVIWAASFRGTVMQASSLVEHRWMPDAVIHGQYQGFTRMGLDGWMAVNPINGNRVNTLTRYRNGWYNLWRNNPISITAPGPDGAVATTRCEMLREGIQEAEARIVLEKGLNLQNLPQNLREEISEFLKARNRVRYDIEGRFFAAGDNWRDTTFQLFDLAGKVSAHAGWTPNIGAAGPRVEGMRVWTNREGVTITARYLGFRDGMIALERSDGRRFTAPLNLFSEADQAWVREQ